ncbi:MAG: hypothetical protein RIQ56_976, partial [Candidatus Parcubacteria bacterium]
MHIVECGGMPEKSIVRRSWGFNALPISVLLVSALAAGALSMLPYALHTFSPDYRGLTVIRDKDYGNYLSRLQRALEGYPHEADNGITPIGSGIRGVQTAGLERIIGLLFGWTNVPAPKLAVPLTGLVMVFNIILVYIVFSSIGLRPWISIIATGAFVAVTFHGLGRVVHPGWSFLFMFGALAAFFRLQRTPTVAGAVCTGLLLGLLPFLYFWSWTYAWVVIACAFVLNAFVHAKEAPLRKRWDIVLLCSGVTLLITLPFVLTTTEILNHPIYSQVSLRASFLLQRTPESWPRSVLLITQCGLLLSLWKNEHRDFSYRAVVAFLLGAVVALHQNVLHNQVLMFSSHYYPHLLLSTTAAAAWSLSRSVREWRHWMIGGVAAVFLLAGVADY